MGNKYIQCPLSGINEAIEKDNSPEIILSEQPGKYVFQRIFVMLFYTAYALNEDQTNPFIIEAVKGLKEEIGCSGTIFS